MNITDKSSLKDWFRRGLKPLQVQFAAWIDSYWHKLEKIPVSAIDGIQEMLDGFTKKVVEIVTEAAKNVQFERRIAIVMETNETVMPIGEPMIIYKATAKNVSKLEVKANDSTVTQWMEVPLDTETEIDISATVPTDALVRITRTTIENISTIYLFTRVIPATDNP